MNLLKTVTGVDLVDIVKTTMTTIASKFPTPITPEQQLQMEQQMLDFLLKEDIAQTEINKIDAASSNKFQSNWRPLVGWTGALSFMLFSIATVVFPIIQVFVPTMSNPDIDWQPVLEILFALLGISGLRTYEKRKGITTK
jgi:hypothetical protein